MSIQIAPQENQTEPYGPFPETVDFEQPDTLPLPVRRHGMASDSRRLSPAKELARLLQSRLQMVIARVSKKLRRLRRWINRTRLGAALITRFRRSPRTAGILVGALIIAAVLMFWRKKPDASETEIATAETEWKLEDVRVYPPGAENRDSSVGPAPKLLQTSEITAKSLTTESTGRTPESQPMPDTPRPVWLTGVIEDLPMQYGVRRVGHVELPMESRDRPVEQAPQFPPYRRR